jgi:hypothetical protein
MRLGWKSEDRSRKQLKARHMLFEFRLQDVKIQITEIKLG